MPMVYDCPPCCCPKGRATAKMIEKMRTDVPVCTSVCIGRRGASDRAHRICVPDANPSGLRCPLLRVPVRGTSIGTGDGYIKGVAPIVLVGIGPLDVDAWVSLPGDDASSVDRPNVITASAWSGYGVRLQIIQRWVIFAGVGIVIGHAISCKIGTWACLDIHAFSSNTIGNAIVVNAARPV